MSTTTRDPDGRALSTETCLSRLAHSRAGYLACSTRALPNVVPVTVHVLGGQLLLDLPDQHVTDQVVGQVVALGVGRPSRAWRRGWSVVARGPLVEVPGQPRSLVLDLQQLEGHTLVRTGDT